MKVFHARRDKELEQRYTRLMRTVAALTLGKLILRGVLARNCEPLTGLEEAFSGYSRNYQRRGGMYGDVAKKHIKIEALAIPYS